jgi:hypothetical protein
VNILDAIARVDEWGEKIGRKEFPLGVTVDDAAIGRLYRFAADSTLDIEHLTEHVQKLSTAIYSLHSTEREYAVETTS